MKCKNCGSLVDSDSLFCPSCGTKQNFDNNSEVKKIVPSSNNTAKYVGIGILILFIIVLLTQLSPKPLTKEECIRMGSNDRMYACLAELERNNPTPPKEPTYLPDNELGGLILEDYKMTGNTYYNPNPTYEATLRNNTGKTVYDVLVKFTFYKYQQSGNCNDPPLDTQYVNVSSMVLSGDSQRVKTIVQTPFDTSGAFSWCSRVTAAKLSK